MLENVVRVTLGDFEILEVIADAVEEVAEGFCVVSVVIAEVLVALVTELEEFVMVETVEVRQLHEQGHV